MSEYTDKVDSDRREDIHFNTWVASCKVELTGHESRKKEIVLEGKEKLEAKGYDKEKISATLGDKFEGYISRQYIRKVLGDEYKYQSKVRDQQVEKADEICATVAQNPEAEKLLVTANGHTVRESDTNPELDSIYGKDFNQMKREADKEIAEDKEETLENPANGPGPVFLSDKSPEFRAMEAKLEELEGTLNQLVEDRDHAISKHAEISKKYRLLKGGSKDEELLRLKVENNNLKTLMADIDKTAIQEQGFKEVEILKLVSERVSWLNEISRKSQRTLFLLVNPKTMEIKGIKTDVEMHQIQAKRAAGVQ